MTGHVLAVRSDSTGDVLLTGPALRAIAARADRVTLLCGPRGEAAGRLLPGVDRVEVAELPWIDPKPKPVERDQTLELVQLLADLEPQEAVIFTSWHQSPLPLALLLRLAGVARICAISSDYPGSLLDLRHRVEDDVHEVERALSLAEAAGFPAPDDRRLQVLAGRLPEPLRGQSGYVAIHPGVSAPERAWPADRFASLVRLLRSRGHQVVVTGLPEESRLTALVAGEDALDLGGRTDLASLAAVLAEARLVIVANTGPAHLAAAVARPVVSLFAPTVPPVRWRPWLVPQVLLGAPRPLSEVTPEQVLEAAESLLLEAVR